MDRRIEARLDAEGLPVKAWGMGSDGRAFVLNAVAYEASYRGARLDGLTCKVAAGDVIAVQYGSQKGRFRVVWVADPASERAGHVGIRTLEDTCIWESELASFDQELRPPQSDPLADARPDRRQYPRFRCPGNVRVSRLGCEQHIWAKLSDLSLGGCYIDSSAPEPVGTKLQLQLQVQDTKICAAGEVRTAVPALGMGVQFTSFEGDSRETLKQIVTKLAPPKLTGGRADAPPDTQGAVQSLVTAVRDHFEGNNVMTSKEFEQIVKALLEKKPAPVSATAPSSRTA
jgi:hypothetical protein